MYSLEIGWHVNWNVSIDCHTDDYVNTPGYGNTGCWVFQARVQNEKDFFLRINIVPEGNYWILRIGWFLVGRFDFNGP